MAFILVLDRFWPSFRPSFLPSSSGSCSISSGEQSPNVERQPQGTGFRCNVQSIDARDRGNILGRCFRGEIPPGQVLRVSHLALS